MIRYDVQIEGFDWDNDRFESNKYSKVFHSLEEAEAHYDMLMALEPDDEWEGKPTKIIQSYTKLADLFNIWHGAIYTGTASITKIVYVRIK